jgi:hypothetical protein
MNTIYAVSEAYEAPCAYFSTLAKAEAYVAKVDGERKSVWADSIGGDDGTWVKRYYIEAETLDEECE